MSRLRTFLSWKDVRKNVRDSDDKGADADLAAGDDPVGGAVPGGPVEDTTKKNKKAKVGLPWEPSSYFNQEVPERDDEEDDEEEEMNYITLQRLRKADERTKVMTREEYVTWSEYRQASFTYRKGKRFREWAGFGIVTDSKPSDDIVDILGFLTFEMVQTLTEEALKIKEQEDLWKERTGGENTGNKKRKLAQGLFDPPSEGRTPVEPRHIQEAFRRLQARPKKSRAMLNGTRTQQHSNLRLVRKPCSPWQLKLTVDSFDDFAGNGVFYFKTAHQTRWSGQTLQHMVAAGLEIKGRLQVYGVRHIEVLFSGCDTIQGCFYRRLTGIVIIATIHRKGMNCLIETFVSLDLV